MKILFAIQGTGNGHLSRAKDIYPELCKHGDVDILVSGYQSDISFPYPVKYKLRGISFIFGKHGGISLWETFKKLNLIRFLKDIINLHVADYDLVVNDFEPVSAWACKWHDVPCIALSHQSAVIHESAPRPKQMGLFGRLILKYYAPFTEHYGFHFKSYGDQIFSPVIRKEIQGLEPTKGNHYTVYLPAYSDEELIRFLHKHKNVQWEVFSKHNKEAFVFENISIRPVNNEGFIESLSSCTGALLGAGFEGPAEALYLQKKVMVVPMKGQYEQQCNAAAIAELGVPVISTLSPRYFEKVEEWILNSQAPSVQFPKETASIAVKKMIDDFLETSAQSLGNSMPEFY